MSDQQIFEVQVEETDVEDKIIEDRHELLDDGPIMKEKENSFDDGDLLDTDTETDSTNEECFEEWEDDEEIVNYWFYYDERAEWEDDEEIINFYFYNYEGSLGEEEDMKTDEPGGEFQWLFSS